MKTKKKNQQGVTLIELLVVVVISSIALIAAAMPFVAEQAFWRTGRERAAAQQDAQMVLRAMARTARQGTGYAVNQGGSSVTISLPACSRDFQLANGNQLQMVDHCVVPAQTLTLIDGVRSTVTQFVATTVVANRLVNIQLEITQGNQEREQLRTQLFLRNAA